METIFTTCSLNVSGGESTESCRLQLVAGLGITPRRHWPTVGGKWTRIQHIDGRAGALDAHCEDILVIQRPGKARSSQGLMGVSRATCLPAEPEAGPHLESAYWATQSYEAAAPHTVSQAYPLSSFSAVRACGITKPFYSIWRAHVARWMSRRLQVLQLV